MASESICRICLTSDAPVRVIANSPLQEVYQKLTNVLLNTPPKPVAACSLCHWQLRKCYKLMTRCLIADELLTNILQTGRLLIDESISMISRVRNELRKDDLCFTPIEIIAIGSKEMENNLIKTELKEEPVSSECTGEMEMDPLSTCGEHLKIERSNNEADMPQDHTQDVEIQELIDEENVKDELLKGMLNTEENSFRNEEEHTESKCMKNMEPKGAGPTEKCEQIHAQQIEHGSTLTPDDSNIQEKRTSCRIVIEVELPSTSVGPYTMQRSRNIPNNSQDFRHSDTATNNSNVSVSSDNDCNTDVDNSSSKHVKKMFICNDCGNMFDDKYLLIEHIEHHNVVKKNNNRCSPRRTILRQQRSSRTGVVNKQTETHSGKDLFKCDICQRIFTEKKMFNIHLQTHTGGKLFECKICKVRFSYKSTLKTHLKLHTGEKPFECEICKIRFTQKGNLKNHLRVHTGEKPFECEICKVRFSDKSTLKTHLIIHTAEKPFKCEICKIRFTQKGNLKKHLRVHTGEKPFECEICKDRFPRKDYLQIHLLVHTGEKPFECEICKVRFNHKSDLKKHLKVHTGEKPFKCGICKVSFGRKDNLKTHLLVHTGEKPFQCEICKVRFSRKGVLKTHLLVHTGEKPFRCEICKVKFREKGTLRTHLRTHT